jgi:hypothetical protein
MSEISSSSSSSSTSSSSSSLFGFTNASFTVGKSDKDTESEVVSSLKRLHEMNKSLQSSKFSSQRPSRKSKTHESVPEPEIELTNDEELIRDWCRDTGSDFVIPAKSCHIDDDHKERALNYLDKYAKEQVWHLHRLFKNSREYRRWYSPHEWILAPDPSKSEFVAYRAVVRARIARAKYVETSRMVNKNKDAQLLQAIELAFQDWSESMR